MSNKPFSIANVVIKPGERKSIELPAASLYTQTTINVPVTVINGKKKGARLFVIAAVHGDEINGVEIIRRLLSYPGLKSLHGTLVAVPVANVHGFVALSRYLPDRRDLNRAFPGSKSGSLTARLAKLFMDEVISRCTHGIDLHTGNIHSENLPHIRTNMDVPGTSKIAKSFNVPVILNAKLPDGSIRQAATELKIPVLVYEGGEALRFNEMAIRIGVRGILNVMHSLGMIHHNSLYKLKRIKSRVAYFNYWARSPRSGIFKALRQLGADVDSGEKIGVVLDPFSSTEAEIFSPCSGIIVGKNTLPLVNEGDALFHVAKMKGREKVTEDILQLQHELNDNLFEFI